VGDAERVLEHTRVVADAAVWSAGAAVGSATIALLALAGTVFNARVARRALRLSEQQEDLRKARLDLSVVDQVSIAHPSKRERWIGVDVLAVNPSDRDGSIFRAELHLTYSTSSGHLMVIRIPHANAGAPATTPPLQVPVALPAARAVQGWLVFRLPDELIGSGRIERYDVEVTDSRGLIERVQPWVMREVDDDEET
jgi:hypothetical protein